MTRDIEFVLGEATDCEARLYVESVGPDCDGGVSLEASISGPYCAHARTLPATVSFRSLNSDGRFLAEAVVADPCFWSPDLPFLYRVRGKVLEGDQVVGTEERLLGMRRYGTRGTDLFLNGRRMVMRGGVARQPIEDATLMACRAAQTSLMVDWPGDALCWRAAELGVFLVARLLPDADIGAGSSGAGSAMATGRAWVEACRRFSRCPAMLAVVLPAADCEGPIKVSAGGRPLMAVSRGDRDTDPLPDWAEAVVVRGRDAGQIGLRMRGHTVPMIAHLASPHGEDPAELREAAERLQRDLTPYGDCAGYLVG